MECQRCHSQMVIERFRDLYDDTGVIDFNGWRCLICGEIFDQVISANRQHHPPPLVGKNRKLIIASKR